MITKRGTESVSHRAVGKYRIWAGDHKARVNDPLRIHVISGFHSIMYFLQYHCVIGVGFDVGVQWIVYFFGKWKAKLGFAETLFISKTIQIDMGLLGTKALPRLSFYLLY